MDFIELLKVIFLGIVEGITEWLPISSTGHLILVEEFVKLDVSKAFWEMFMVVIQLGAIMAVVVLYWNKIWPFQNKKPKHENVTKIEKAAGFVCRFTKIDKMVMWFKILVSCLPAIIIGLPFDDFIEEKFNNWFVVAVVMHYNSDYTEAGVYELSDYTEALAKTHGIHEENSEETFSLSALKSAAQEIGEITTGGSLSGDGDSDSGNSGDSNSSDSSSNSDSSDNDSSDSDSSDSSDNDSSTGTNAEDGDTNN